MSDSVQLNLTGTAKGQELDEGDKNNLWVNNWDSTWCVWGSQDSTPER